MSSPAPPFSSQVVESTDNDTPGTTPPAPTSTTATPNPDIEMEETSNSQDNDEHQQSSPNPNDSNKQADTEEEEEDSSLSLPLSKVKKIFKMDPEYVAASQSAVYVTAAATELFIQYFVEHASLSAKVDRRKKIVYKDCSSAVSNQDALQFLSDTVPKTQPIGDLIQQKKVNLIEENNVGQSSIDEIEIDDAQNHEAIEEQNKPPIHDKPMLLPKNQQTLNFAPAPKEQANPIKKAVIHDLVTTNEDSGSVETTVEPEDKDSIIVD